MNRTVCLYKGKCPYQKTKRIQGTDKTYVACKQPQKETCNQKRVISPNEIAILQLEEKRWKLNK